ncbi:MAG: ATPase [Tissierellia bacterium]|nr:ATPase [Tissierellia bacterium]
MNLQQLDQKINQLNNKINGDKGRLDILHSELETNTKQINDLEAYGEILTQVSLLFQKTSQFAREQAKQQIEDIVSKCLQFIFEVDIEFIIELGESRGVPVAEFYVRSNYDEGYSIKTKPEIARGGGVVDIISIALRIAFIQIHQPEISGPIILDEPGKHVSDDFIFNLGEFLKRSSSLFQRQIIMVTHNAHLSQICDRSFIVTINRGVSKVSINDKL